MPTTAVEELNIILAGVGGQGVILMSDLLGNSALADGLNIQGSEVLGMAQRGGSVFSNIRLGDGAVGPLTPQGKCDILVAVEPSEALRYVKELAPSALVILNTTEVRPYTVATGESAYPAFDVILATVRKVTKQIIPLDATQIAKEAGNALAANTAMLGALFGSGRLPIKVETMKELIKSRVPPKAVEANLKAFDMGYAAVAESLNA
ncbi:MAG: indolepyruvate oxidoreductase subunit beta [Actinomycetia bacterium]|nr:indolepyruvate oxidoreductase subunit beta [Actinomycetes bacterium]